MWLREAAVVRKRAYDLRGIECGIEQYRCVSGFYAASRILNKLKTRVSKTDCVAFFR
jgi:hypothetical protein